MRPGRNWGWIEVITGPMFSGKSEELIRRLRRAVIARQRIQVFKPVIDTRYSDSEVVSHSLWRIPSEPVRSSAQILKLLDPRTEVVGIDEAQFFDDQLPHVCKTLADMGKRVIVAGLDMDYRGEPFGPMPYLLAIAEEVQKLSAVCARCGAPASYTQRLVDYADQVLVGSSESYEPRCRRCHEPEGAGDWRSRWLLPPGPEESEQQNDAVGESKDD